IGPPSSRSLSTHLVRAPSERTSLLRITGTTARKHKGIAARSAAAAEITPTRSYKHLHAPTSVLDPLHVDPHHRFREPFRFGGPLQRRLRGRVRQRRGRGAGRLRGRG